MIEQKQTEHSHINWNQVLDGIISREIMDPRVWSRMPEDLLEYILSFLPLKTFLNLRSTCKHFKTLLFSPPFISKHSPTSSSSPFSSFLLLSHPQFPTQYPLFDTAHNNWRNLSLCISPKLSCAPSSSSYSVLLSSSNGLLCFSRPSSNSFIISNVLVRSSRVVKFPTYPFAFESLTLVSSPNGYYKLFVMSSTSGSSHCYFVYDSLVHSWRRFGGFDLILSENHHQEGVFHGGYLYFITPEPFSMVFLDLDTGLWQKSKILMPSELTFARMVSDGDKRMFLIGGVGRNGISRSMKLWELDDKNWVEVENVPELICRKFLSVCYHNYEHVYCFWHQGLVCVCCSSWPEILYYKVDRRTWHWLPKCPSLPDKCSCGFRWFSYVPELYALV